MQPNDLFSLATFIDQVHEWATPWVNNLLPWLGFLIGLSVVFVIARGIYEFFSDHIGGFTDVEGEFPLVIPKANFLQGPKADLPFDNKALLSQSGFTGSANRGYRKDVYYHGFQPRSKFEYVHSYVSNFNKDNLGKKVSANEIIEKQYPKFTPPA